MSLSRIVLSSLKHRICGTIRSPVRFSPVKRFHSSNYFRSAKQSNKVLFPNQAPKSSWRSYVLPTAFLGGIGGIALLLHYNDERRAFVKGEGANYQVNTTKGPIIGGPFSLFDTEGRLVTERDLRGNWVLLYFGYTSSPDVGPAEVEKMAKAVSILESKQNLKVLPVFVTIDPQRDNAAQLRAYLKEFDPRIVGLTGSVAAIREMAREYRVYFKKIEEDGDDYLVDSSHNMYLINPELKVARCIGIEYNAEELSEAMLKEIKQSGT